MTASSRRYRRTVLRDSPVRRLICRIDSPCRANIRISAACSWVNMSAAQKTAILAQVGHFHDLGPYRESLTIAKFDCTSCGEPVSFADGPLRQHRFR